MARELVTENPDAGEAVTVDYEPPKVESVLTAEDLAREIQYAGISV